MKKLKANESQTNEQRTERSEGHTPTPWKIGYWDEIITDSNGYKIALADPRNPNDKKDTAFIVRAVNNHEALLNAAKYAINVIKSSGRDIYVEPIEKAIAQAEGRLSEANQAEGK